MTSEDIISLETERENCVSLVFETGERFGGIPAGSDGAPLKDFLDSALKALEVRTFC